MSIGDPNPDNVHIYSNSPPSGSTEVDPSIWNGSPAVTVDSWLGLKI